jgi:dienelactone hydrolase
MSRRNSRYAGRTTHQMPRVVMGLLVVGFASVGLSAFAHEHDAQEKTQERQEKPDAADWGGYKVGHTIMSVTLLDSDNPPKVRPLHTLIWYPADSKSYKHAPPSTYKPLLHGVALPAPWHALSWEFAAERARENPALKTRGRPYPLIVLSHPAMGDPFSNSKICERLASYGYIVAAPTHNGDTQDEVRIDFINDIIRKAGGTVEVPCLDRQPGPCIDGLNKSMRDRALDVRAVIDNIPSLFGEHVDMSRIGFVGASRGSATGLSVAGGSTGLRIAPDPRVDALFLLTAGGAANPLMNLAAITIPTVQVSGTKDRNLSTSRATFDAISSSSKAYVVITSAWHRGLSGDSYCEQMQAIGPIAQSDKLAILDLHSLQNLILRNPNPIQESGTTLDVCPYEFFVDPVDITPIVFEQTKVQVTPENVPTSIEMAVVSIMASDLARAFFGDVLDVRGDDNFGEYLIDEFQEKYSENLTAVELPSWH